MNKLLLIILTIFAGCTSKKEAPAESAPQQNNSSIVSLTDAQIKNAGIETGKPEMRAMQATLKVNGLIDVPPQNRVTISFPLGGYLKTTQLIPGMWVRKGQVIAVLQDQSFIQMQQDYLETKAKLTFLQKEYERQKALNATKTTSDKLFEQTTSEYESQKVMLKALSEKLLLININPNRLNVNSISRSVNLYSPITGYVTSVDVNIGKYVSPTDVLFEFVDPNDLHLALTIFEKDLAAVHIGQKVQAYLTNDTTKTYYAEVILVGKNLDSNRSTLVHCHFTGAAPKLLPGMFINAVIQSTTADAVAVPEEAVVRSGDKEYIFIERQPKQFEMTPVNTTVSQNGFVGINPGDTKLLNETIIRKNAYAALMKMQNTGEEE